MDKRCCKGTIWRKGFPALLVFLGSLGFFLVPRALYGKTAAEVLKAYDGLSEKERENRLIEGATREGKLVFYGVTTVDQTKRIFEEFEKKYPFVTISHHRSGAGSVYNKILTESRANRHEVDVVELESGPVYLMVKSGLADPYLSPSRKGIMPEFMDKDGYWTAIYHLVVALGYNTNHVRKEEVPKNYESLLDPKWKGRMSLDQTDMHLMGTLLEHWGRDKALAYFKKLAANEPMLRRGRSLQAQILAAGEVHMAPWLYGYRPATMKRQGAPVDTTLLEPILTVPTYLMLAKNSPHPHATALFIDWALSRDGAMRIFAEELGNAAPRLGYKDKYPELIVSKYLVVDPRHIGPHFEEYTKLFCSIFKGC